MIWSCCITDSIGIWRSIWMQFSAFFSE